MYPVSPELPSHPGCHITLNWVPWAIQQVRPFRSFWSKRQLTSSRRGFSNCQYYSNQKILQWYSVWWSRCFQRSKLLFCQGILPPICAPFPHFIFPFTFVLSINFCWWLPPGGNKSRNTWVSKTEPWALSESGIHLCLLATFPTLLKLITTLTDSDFWDH